MMGQMTSIPASRPIPQLLCVGIYPGFVTVASRLADIQSELRTSLIDPVLIEPDSPQQLLARMRDSRTAGVVFVEWGLTARLAGPIITELKALDKPCFVIDGSRAPAINLDELAATQPEE